MTTKEMLGELDNIFDKWIMDYRPDSEDYEKMDNILNELRKRVGEKENG